MLPDTEVLVTDAAEVESASAASSGSGGRSLSVSMGAGSSCMSEMNVSTEDFVFRDRESMVASLEGCALCAPSSLLNPL